MRSSRFLTPQQVADELGVTRWAVYGLIKRGTLRAARLGRGWRVSVEDLRDFRDLKGRKPR